MTDPTSAQERVREIMVDNFTPVFGSDVSRAAIEHMVRNGFTALAAKGYAVVDLRASRTNLHSFLTYLFDDDTRDINDDVESVIAALGGPGGAR
jgi:predicted GNAT superfamily acetyltransferase